MEYLRFDRKAVCDFCGFETKVSCCNYGTTNYKRLVCLDCAIKINDRHRVLFNEKVFDFAVNTIENQVKKEVKDKIKKVKDIAKVLKDLYDRNIMIRKRIITIELSIKNGSLNDKDNYWSYSLDAWKKSLAYNINLIKKYQDLYIKEMEKD